MASNRPSDFLKRAIELAVENARSGSGGPFGAVVVKDGAILAEGVNQVTSSNDPTAHAEIVAIRKACRKLGSFQIEDCEIYTSCEPCPMCLGAIYWARPREVWFGATRRDAARAGFDDDLLYRQLRRPPGRRRIPMRGRMRRQALRAFEEWEARPDRIPY